MNLSRLVQLESYQRGSLAAIRYTAYDFKKVSRHLLPIKKGTEK